jgi:hypothetical protein
LAIPAEFAGAKIDPIRPARRLCWGVHLPIICLVFNELSSSDRIQIRFGCTPLIRKVASRILRAMQLPFSNLKRWIVVCAILAVAIGTRSVLTMTDGPVFSPQAVLPPAASAPQTVTVTFAAATTVQAVQVLTQGAANLDFQISSGDPGTCAPGGYNAGDTCTVNVTFQPTAAGLRSGAVVLVSDSGDYSAIVPLSGTGLGAVGMFGTGTTTSLFPAGVQWTAALAIDGTGNVYTNHQGSKGGELDEFPADGSPMIVVATVSGEFGQISIDGTGRIFSFVGGQVLVLPPGTQNFDANHASADTLFGNPNAFAHPTAMALDTNGDVFLANYGAGNIIEIPSVGGVLQTSQQVAFPVSAIGLAFDTSGNLYSTQIGDGSLSRTPVENGVLNFAHTAVVLSGLINPTAIGMDAGGNLYVGQDNGVSLVPFANGAFDLASATLLTSAVQDPSTILPDGMGNVYVADTAVNHWQVLELSFQFPQTLMFTTAVGTTSAPQSETLFNAGNVTLNAGTPTTAAPFQMFGTVCSHTTPVPPGGACQLSATFTPAAVGHVTGSIRLTAILTNASATQSVPLDGTASNETPLVTVALDSQSSNPTYGQNLGLSIDVTSQIGSPHPGGSFLITVDGGASQTEPVSVTGPIDFGIGSLSVSTHSVSVTYQPDANNSAFSTASGSLNFTVATAAPLFQVSSPGTFVYGQSPTINVSFQTSGSEVPPTGSITYQIDNLPLQNVTIGTNPAAAQIPLNGLVPVNGGNGSHSVSVTYNGDANYNSTLLTSTHVTVLPATSSVSITSTPSTYGGSSSFTVTVSGVSGGASPGGSITYQVDGGAFQNAPLTSSGPTQSSASASIAALSVGSHTLSVSYTGDGNYSSANGTGSLQVNKAQALFQVNAPAPYPYGQTASVNVTFQTSGNQTAPSGTVTYQIDNGVIQSVNIGANPAAASLPLGLLSVVNGGAGSHSVTINYGGDSNFNSGSLGTVNVTVTRATPGVSVSASPVSYPAHSTFTATVSSPFTGTAAPSGTITYQIDGGALQNATLSVSSQNSTQGVATVDTGSLTAGSHNLTVNYGGDNNYNSGNTVTGATLQVNKSAQTVTITTPGPGSQINYAASPMTLAATASSGLTSFNWSVLSGPASISGGGTTLTFTGKGSVTVQATQSGNTDYNFASATSTFTVMTVPTSLKLTGVPSTVPAGSTLNTTATVQVLDNLNQPTSVCGSRETSRSTAPAWCISRTTGRTTRSSTPRRRRRRLRYRSSARPAPTASSAPGR